MPVLETLAALAIALPLIALAGVADAQQATGSPDTEYIAKATSAGPTEIANDATRARMVNGGMQTLRKGTNEYTCMVTNAGPMCMGPIAMEWAQAWHNHTPPPYALGFIYMLNGDAGMSNTDPLATKPAPGNHWVKTGPHVMMVGLAVKKMTGFLAGPIPTQRSPT